MKMTFFLFLLLHFNFMLAQQDTIISLEGEMLRFHEIDSEKWNHPFKERIGKTATPFEMKDSEGRLQSSDQYAGKVLILYFWNVWDWDSCEKQTTALNTITEKYRQDVAVVSFVREKIGLEEFAFLQDHQVKFPIVPQAEAFGMEYHGYEYGTPLIFFVNRKGIWQHICRQEEELEMRVQQLIR